jgi:hypothetical protein
MIAQHVLTTFKKVRFHVDTHTVGTLPGSVRRHAHSGLLNDGGGKALRALAAF